MQPPSEGQSRCLYPWLWPAIFVTIFTLVLVAVLLPWTKTDMGGSLTRPPASAVKDATIAPARSAVEDDGSALAQAPNVDQIGLLAALLRHGIRPEGLTSADYPGVDVLLATPLYFRLTGRRLPAPDRTSIVFFVSEEVHIGELPTLPPRPLLKVGRVYHEPVEVRMLTDSPHHRTTIVLYDAAWSDGGPVVTPEARSLEMVFPAGSSASGESVLSWDLPIPYAPSYSSRELSIAGAGGIHTISADQYAGHTDQPSSGYFGRESSEALSGFSDLQAASFTLVPGGTVLGSLSRVSGLDQGHLTWRPRTAMTRYVSRYFGGNELRG